MMDFFLTGIFTFLLVRFRHVILPDLRTKELELVLNAAVFTVPRRSKVRYDDEFRSHIMDCPAESKLEVAWGMLKFATFLRIRDFFGMDKKIVTEFIAELPVEIQAELSNPDFGFLGSREEVSGSIVDEISRAKREVTFIVRAYLSEHVRNPKPIYAAVKQACSKSEGRLDVSVTSSNTIDPEIARKLYHVEGPDDRWNNFGQYRFKVSANVRATSKFGSGLEREVGQRANFTYATIDQVIDFGLCMIDQSVIYVFSYGISSNRFGTGAPTARFTQDDHQFEPLLEYVLQLQHESTIMPRNS